jgi:hypothetical protein
MTARTTICISNSHNGMDQGDWDRSQGVTNPSFAGFVTLPRGGLTTVTRRYRMFFRLETNAPLEISGVSGTGAMRRSSKRTATESE